MIVIPVFWRKPSSAISSHSAPVTAVRARLRSDERLPVLVSSVRTVVRVSSRSGGERTVISADGTAIVMTVAGEGPPLLLVHGASATHRSWDGVTPFLAHEFEVFAMARRGRPPSGDANEYALLLEVQDVIACVNAIGASTRVLGHSSGGLCALEAARSTSKIERLVTYEPAMGLASDPTPLLRDLEALLAEGRDEEALLTFLSARRQRRARRWSGSGAQRAGKIVCARRRRFRVNWRLFTNMRSSRIDSAR